MKVKCNANIGEAYWQTSQVAIRIIGKPRYVDNYDDDDGMAMTVKVIIMMMVIMIIPTMRMKTLVKNMVMMVMVV